MLPHRLIPTSNKPLVDMSLCPRCTIPPHFAADNRLVQRLQSGVCPCRLQVHGPAQFAIITGIWLVGPNSALTLYTSLTEVHER